MSALHIGISGSVAAAVVLAQLDGEKHLDGLLDVAWVPSIAWRYIHNPSPPESQLHRERRTLIDSREWPRSAMSRWIFQANLISSAGGEAEVGGEG